MGSHLNLLAGLDYRRDAPHDLDLARADPQGRLQLVTSNNLTISDYGPFAALQADLGRSLKFYAGLRRDEIRFANTDKLTGELLRADARHNQPQSHRDVGQGKRARCFRRLESVAVRPSM